ncbi:hypothetical protein I4F81_010658 [Pyropia yezoensis]|uniref:Uncharacterized protein n=1 Tax=Pyropia yezoensis TaxID=2788 RepID=A0ACC3CDZ9_PYRYE|nr:hypothetical protein I4F81_010658 [Neopyropia yezoensis]
MGGGGGVPGGLGGHVAGGHAPPPHPSNLSAVHYASGPAVVSLNEHERVVTSLQDQLLHARGEIDRLVGRLNDFERQSRYWTPEEHQRFLDAMERFGPKDVRAIAAYVGSRNATQVRTHSQKYTLRLQRENRELPLAGTRKRSMSESDLRRVGRDGAEEPDRPFGGGGRPRRL